MTTYTTLTIPAAQYADADDCLAAAAADVAQEHGVPAGYDMSPRWADDDRDEILVDVPLRATTAADVLALVTDLYDAGGNLRVVVDAMLRDYPEESAEEIAAMVIESWDEATAEHAANVASGR